METLIVARLPRLYRSLIDVPTRVAIDRRPLSYHSSLPSGAPALTASTSRPSRAIVRLTKALASYPAATSQFD
jgi:hypothetical protein